MTSPRIVVVDIEGTVTPISFVKDTLFPYSRQRLSKFVTLHQRDPEVASALEEAKALAEGGDPLVALAKWIEEDRKVGPLKTLQGLIWEEGYVTGVLQAPVYPDAAQALRAWHDAGVMLAVYSSGSVPAQKLLFAYSDQGDLTALFSGWFDLATGPKLETESYKKIAAALGGSGLFLSDHPGELDAAEAAGWQAIRLDRGKDSMAAPPSQHRTVKSLTEITVEASALRA
jgi:enolase-phosphatase E1